ncbi:MAG: hypothetical protein AAB925_01055 [Patescibacteria group bacterium]
MNSFSKSFIIFYLIIAILGAFAFHWFFIDKMMPASECLSTNCAYSSTQTVIPPETMNILLIALLAILIAVILPLAIPLDNRFIKIPGRMFLKWKIEGFCRKLISWLKILEKRDPQTALIAARISDFSQ